MLKTLRITSLVVLLLTVGGVAAIAVFALRDDSEILAFIQKPGVVDAAKENLSPDKDKKDDESPLVAQLKAFALRINPPAPPKPKQESKPEAEKKSKPELTREKPKKIVKKDPPTPKNRVNAKFTLLATVLCQAQPTRSMALLEQSGGKQEWFRQGEQVGHLDIDEVRDGSVIFSQNGRNEQELFVPAKPQSVSLLKNEHNQASAKAGPGSINVRLDADSQDVSVSLDQDDEPTTAVEEDGRIRMSRSRRDSDASERIRTRVTPRVRTAKEQKESIEKNISGIQAIMERGSNSGNSEASQKENEAWMKLLKALEGEKNVLDKADEAESKKPSQPPEKPDGDDKPEGPPPSDNPPEGDPDKAPPPRR